MKTREEERGRERRKWEEGWGCWKGGDWERENERAGRWVGIGRMLRGRRLARERDRERKRAGEIGKGREQEGVEQGARRGREQEGAE